jgi:hypothetical protein
VRQTRTAIFMDEAENFYAGTLAGGEVLPEAPGPDAQVNLEATYDRLDLDLACLTYRQLGKLFNHFARIRRSLRPPPLPR